MTSFYQFFEQNPLKKVEVGEVKYDPVVGTVTVGGYYKNGWRARVIEGDKNYIELHFYTSAGSEIVIEERWLIREDDKICKRTGWNNINLLKMDTIENHRKDLNTYKIKQEEEESDTDEEEEDVCSTCGKDYEDCSTCECPNDAKCLMLCKIEKEKE